MKECKDCHKVLPESEFYDIQGECKNCTKSRVALNYSKNREYYSAYEHIRNQRPERRVKREEYRRARRLRNPEKARCERAFSYAIKKGALIRQLCEICGKKAQGHHEDYSKPLEVRWLCFRHHREVHHQSVVID